MPSWIGRGKGRKSGQSTISGRDSWTGSGGGRSSTQPTIEDGSLLGTRSEQSTTALTSSTGTVYDGNYSHVADPEGSYVFALEIDGLEVAHFLECSGLKTSTEVFELQEGGMNHRVHKLPGQSRWENIVLRYGVTNNIDLLEWRDMILSDAFDQDSRKNGAIILKNNQMEAVRRYDFYAAWPVSWEGPSMSAQGAELAIETLELAHHGVTVA